MAALIACQLLQALKESVLHIFPEHHIYTNRKKKIPPAQGHHSHYSDIFIYWKRKLILLQW